MFLEKDEFIVCSKDNTLLFSTNYETSDIIICVSNILYKILAFKITHNKVSSIKDTEIKLISM